MKIKKLFIEPFSGIFDDGDLFQPTRRKSPDSFVIAQENINRAWERSSKEFLKIWFEQEEDCEESGKTRSAERSSRTSE